MTIPAPLNEPVHVDELQDTAARQAEQLAQKIDWAALVPRWPPPQSWFDEEEPKPF